MIATYPTEAITAMVKAYLYEGKPFEMPPAEEMGMDEVVRSEDTTVAGLAAEVQKLSQRLAQVEECRATQGQAMAPQGNARLQAEVAMLHEDVRRLKARTQQHDQMLMGTRRLLAALKELSAILATPEGQAECTSWLWGSGQPNHVFLRWMVGNGLLRKPTNLHDIQR